ncbi:MAG: DUF4340 domain-containing protein [Candidatus Brocadiia bacterium]|jgi:hypothetical protein
MKLRMTIILLVLVIGLGAFLLMYTARQPSTSTFKEEQSRLFAGSEFHEPGAPSLSGLSDLATKLELRHGDATIELERPAEGLNREWRIVKPLSVSADSGAVIALLGEIEFLKATRRLTPEAGQPLDLKSYGLEPPERSITFGIGDKSWTLNVGAQTPDRQSVYVARADAKTPLVSVAPVSLLEKASERVNDLRDKAALRFDKTAVTRVDLVRAGGSTALTAGGTALALSREATGWRLAGAVEDDADAAAVARLLDALAALRVGADDFIADGDDSRAAEFGLDKPRFKLSVLEGQTSLALLLGADVKDHPDKCYARREGGVSVFALDKQAADGLMKSAADLRSRVALDFNADQVTAITIAPAADPGKPAQTIRLVHSKDPWTMEEPAGVTVDPERAVLFLNDLHNLEVTDWVDNPPPERLAECGLAAPQMTITLQTQPDAAPDTLRFGKPADKPETCYARRGDQGPILIVPAELLASLAVGPLLFVSRTMLEFNKDEAVAVRIVRPDGAVALEQRDNRWMVVEPAPGEANRARVENLLYGLAFLDAKRVEAEKTQSLAAYGLDAPRIQVTVSLKPAETPKPGQPAAPPALKTVLIGKELSEGDSYAMIAGGERIFVLKGPTVNLFLVDFVMPKKPEPPKESR